VDVFVVGGGPAGLAAAIAARRQGFDVAVADSAVPPIDKACGEGIMPDGLAAAASLGIPLGPSLGCGFRGIRFCERDLSVEASFPGGAGLGVRRTALHALLVECAANAGVRFAWGSHVVGMDAGHVAVNGRLVRAGWIIGADGGQSRVRHWAGLETSAQENVRFGFRRHYRLAPWSEYMELHWGEHSQLYITPVAAEELCVVLISRDAHFRLDQALPEFPQVARRLAAAPWGDSERGGASVTRRLQSVSSGHVALIGDASGSVDAITGDGLCLSFQQAAALARALAAGDLNLYERDHRRIGRRPAFMGRLMLFLDGRGRLRARTLRAFAQKPELFEEMLASHLGHISHLRLALNGFSLGWQMLHP